MLKMNRTKCNVRAIELFSSMFMAVVFTSVTHQVRDEIQNQIIQAKVHVGGITTCLCAVQLAKRSNRRLFIYFIRITYVLAILLLVYFCTSKQKFYKCDTCLSAQCMIV